MYTGFKPNETKALGNIWVNVLMELHKACLASECIVGNLKIVLLLFTHVIKQDLYSTIAKNSSAKALFVPSFKVRYSGT